MIVASQSNSEGKKVDNMKLHRQMYERRLRLLKEHDGLTEGDADGAAEPIEKMKDNED